MSGLQYPNSTCFITYWHFFYPEQGCNAYLRLDLLTPFFDVPHSAPGVRVLADMPWGTNDLKQQVKVFKWVYLLPPFKDSVSALLDRIPWVFSDALSIVLLFSGTVIFHVS